MGTAGPQAGRWRPHVPPALTPRPGAWSEPTCHPAETSPALPFCIVTAELGKQTRSGSRNPGTRGRSVDIQSGGPAAPLCPAVEAKSPRPPSLSPASPHKQHPLVPRGLTPGPGRSQDLGARAPKVPGRGAPVEESQDVQSPCSREPGRLFPLSRISSGTGSRSQSAAPSVTGGRAIALVWPPAPPQPPRGQKPSALNR